MGDATKREIALDVQGLWAGYGSEAVLQDVSLQVSQGDIMGIIGPIGAGTSTPFKTILGLL